MEVVALDAAIGEVDAEKLVEPARALADIFGARRVLGINDPLARARVPVGELEELRVEVGRQTRSVGVHWPAGIGAAGVEERIQFLDRRQSPVVEPAKLGGVELRGERLGLGQRQLVAPGQRAIAIGVGAARPGQARDIVANRQTVGTQPIAGWMGLELRVLAVERLARFRGGDFVAVVVTLRLAGSDDGVGLRGAEAGA